VAVPENARRAAAIDVGTNSVLLTIAVATPEGLLTEVERATITRLGEGVDRTRRLSPSAEERTLACLEAYAELLAERNVDAVALVGTSALRDAAGGEHFIRRAREIVGTELEVISGRREAELTFRGSVSGLSVEGPVTVYDIGGGSTEIIHGFFGPRSDAGASSRGRVVRIDAATSLDVGSVRLTERHVTNDPPSETELDAVREDVRGELAALAPLPPHSKLIGVAGTVTTLAALDQKLDPYDAERVHGSALSASALERLVAELAVLPLSVRQTLPGLEPRRADVIVAGSVLTLEILRWAGARETLVSDRGVRWGLLEELLDEETPRLARA
jgi:exopolyphosphatase/guanosine-5'-triphosphate,3'-diphosphate pyrophosphatase